MGRGLAGARRRDDAREVARGTIHAVAVPFLDGVDRPIGFLVGMTTVARVGNAEFLRELRVGNREAMVAPRVTLHVDGHRHVAIDAMVAGLTRFVVRVRGGINFHGRR